MIDTNDIINKIEKNRDIIKPKFSGVFFEVSSEEGLCNSCENKWREISIFIPTKEKRENARTINKIKKIFNPVGDPRTQVMLVDGDGNEENYPFWSIRLQ